ncbi:MAG: glucodextranase DOMON-like domain-containing protein [Deinococcales bacterium]
MIFGALAAGAILFSVSDPAADALGDGGYVLPVAKADVSQLDIRTFSAIDNHGKLELRLQMGRISNPDQAPNGFSRPVIDVFIGTGRGGVSTLGNSGFTTRANSGWYYHIRATPFAVMLRRDSSADYVQLPKNRTAQAKVEGSSIVIQTDIPASDYTYYAISSLYDSLTPTGIAQPQSEPSALKLLSPLEDAPSALDIVFENRQILLWATREVPPLNEPQLGLNPLLFTGLAGFIILLVTTIWGFFTPQRDTWR